MLCSVSKRGLPPNTPVPIRWELWRQVAFKETRGKNLAEGLDIVFYGREWVTSAAVAVPSVEFLATIPGWVDPGDGYGPPLRYRYLSPVEERAAWNEAPLQYKKMLLDHMSVAPHVSTKILKEAERLFQKTQQQKIRKRLEEEQNGRPPA